MSDATEQASTSASKQRIAEVGTAWHKILGVTLIASAEEVKRSYRQLALLHHPDKPGGDSDTFKKIQEAYVAGLQKGRKEAVAATAKGSPKRKAGEDKPAPKRARKNRWTVPADAPASKIRKVVEQYEDSDKWEDKTLPDHVRTVSPDEFAKLILDSACIPVDVREPEMTSKHDWWNIFGKSRLNAEGAEVQGAIQLSYSTTIFAPDEAVPTINRLRNGDGKIVVLFSEQPGIMSTCGMVSAILLDIFGLNEQRVCRLAGGCAAWEDYLDTNPTMAKSVEMLMMRLAQRNEKLAEKVAATPKAGEDALRADVTTHTRLGA